MKTYSMKKSEIDKKWFIIDATDLVLGRLSAIVATYLRGKHKPTYTPHMDCGDNIIIVNADKVHLTGRKLDQRHGKKYFRHTGYMGGLKETTALRIMQGKFPERVVQVAVKRMLAKNTMGRTHMSNLFVYSGPDHRHEAQQPQVLDVASFNNKNKRSS
jgi:large subunit ribosomal protein L13